MRSTNRRPTRRADRVRCRRNPSGADVMVVVFIVGAALLLAAIKHWPTGRTTNRRDRGNFYE